MTAGKGSIATLSVGSLTIGLGSALSLDLFGLSNADQVMAASANISGATLSLNIGAIVANDTYTILHMTGGAQRRAAAGTFNGLPEGQTFSISGVQFKITYAGGTFHNDVVLTALTGSSVTTSPTLVNGSPTLNGNGGGFVNITTSGVTTNTLVPGYIENASASKQHSMVESVVYSFSQAVTLSTSNFTLSGLPGSGTTVAPTVVVTPSSDGTVRTVTFTGAGVNTATHSIGDGEYQLILNGPPGLTSNTYDFYRLLGDIDGSGGVDSGDLLTLNGTFLRSPTDPGYLGAMDFDGSNTVDSADLLQFDSNFLHTVPKMSNGLLPN